MRYACRNCKDDGMLHVYRLCPSCNGSGEGRHEGISCAVCKTGEVETLTYCGCDKGNEKYCEDHYDVDKEMDDYLEYIDDMQDSNEHKKYMLESAVCFYEWILEFGNILD